MGHINIPSEINDTNDENAVRSSPMNSSKRQRRIEELFLNQNIEDLTPHNEYENISKSKLPKITRFKKKMKQDYNLIEKIYKIKPENLKQIKITTKSDNLTPSNSQDVGSADFRTRASKINMQDLTQVPATMSIKIGGKKKKAALKQLAPITRESVQDPNFNEPPKEQEGLNIVVTESIVI